MLEVRHEYPAGLTLSAALAHSDPLGRARGLAHVPGVWRYAALLPVRDPAHVVTLGEGGTPLVSLARWGRRCGLRRVFAKLEYAGPTASFKDRGATTLVSAAVAAAATQIVEDSSGNAGAAIAAYAARAGLPCTIFAPAAAPASKLRQIGACGARLVPVEGPREAVAQAAADAARANADAYYAAHNSNPLFVEGCKTLAYELAEAFGAEAPEHVVMPVGGGALYYGTWLGLNEWLRLGWLDHLPRLHIVQADGCAPLVVAARQGLQEPAAVQRRPTVAGGIEIARAPRGRQLLAALRASGGSAVAVGDEAILGAQAELAASEGIYCEPTSAAAFAGLEELAHRGVVRPDERVVVAVTGTGLKA